MPNPHTLAEQQLSRPMRGSIFAEVPALVSLAVPIVAGLAGSSAVSVIDSLMLGPLGEIPLAAASLTQSVLVIFYAAVYGLVGAIGLLVGQAHGARDPRTAADMLRHGLRVGSAGGLICSITMALLLPLLPLSGQPAEVVEAMPSYWIAMSFVLLPFAQTMAMKQFFDAIERPWTGALLCLPPALLVVPLNWLLIYGNLGFPKLGLTGAGLANFTAFSLGYLIMLLYLMMAPSMRPYRKVIRFHARNILTLTREGFPMSLQYLAEGSAVAIAGILIGLLGATALAANQIVFSLAVLVYMAPLGLAGAVSIRIAQAIGERSLHRVRAIGVAGLAVVTVWMLVFTAIMLLYGRPIAALFIDSEPVIELATAMFVAIGVMQIFDGLQSVALGAMRGILDNIWPARVSLVAYWLVALPLSAVFGFTLGYGAAGVWAGFGIGLAVAAVLLVGRFLKKSDELLERASLKRER